METSVYDRLTCADELRRLDDLYSKKKGEVTQALTTGHPDVWRLVREETQLRHQILEVERQETDKVPDRVALLESQLQHTQKGLIGSPQAYVTAEEEAAYEKKIPE